MPTKRSQNIPGKAPRPSRNSHNRSAGFAEAARAALIPLAKQLHRLFHLCAQKPLGVEPSAKTKGKGGFSNASTMASAPHSTKWPAAFPQRNRAPKCYLRAGTCLLERAPSQALPLWAADFRLPPTR